MLRISTLAAEPPFQVGKWIRIQALLSCEEMRRLFSELGNFLLYQVSGVVDEGEEQVSREQFLLAYCQYVKTLEQGFIPDEEKFFSCVLTTMSDHLYAIPVKEKKWLIRVAKPVIQLQAHRMEYSTFDKKFRSMVFGKESISWGLQFSYPQIYEDPTTKEIIQVKQGPTFPNTKLFQQLRKWIRDHTLPVPFFAEEKKVTVSVRIGKECFSWINQHPQLLKKNIQVLI